MHEETVKLFNALVDVRASALDALRNGLATERFTEVSTSSLVNIAGSCEDPDLSFRLGYFGKEAYLSQSAQLQLEPLVIRLGRKVFSINSSFRAENFHDPEKKDRMLSEFTLVEPEGPCADNNAANGLRDLEDLIERLIRNASLLVINTQAENLRTLGGNPASIEETVRNPFKRINYEEAWDILKANRIEIEESGDLGIRGERAILREYNQMATLVSYHPASLKFFNLKKAPDGEKAYSVDLLLPPMGEVVGGGVREESLQQLKKNLASSKVGMFLRERGVDPNAPFAQYFSMFDSDHACLRAGCGIGFERFVAFLIGSSDIIRTVFHRTLVP
jgi:asparaginyl-tRNA synthetase